MPRKPATPEQRAEVRRRIRQAAAEVYAESGILGISVRAIATRAGISTGSIYGYYASLQELMRSLWAAPVAAANEGLESIAKKQSDPIRRIQALLQAYVDFARQNPQVFRGVLLFVRPEPLPPPERRPLREFVLHDLLQTALREGQAQGRVRKGNADQMAQTLWAGVHGALALPINVDGAAFDAPEVQGRRMIRTLLRSIEAE